MIDILSSEWASHGFQRNEMLLIDDDKSNIARAIVAGFRGLFVPDSFLGPNWQAVHAELSHLPFPSSMQYYFLTTHDHFDHSSSTPASPPTVPLSTKFAVALKFLSKMQAHSPARVNEALTHLGVLSKPPKPKPASPPPAPHHPSNNNNSAHTTTNTPHATPATHANNNTDASKASKRKLDDERRGDLFSLVDAVNFSLQSYTLLKAKMRKLGGEDNENGGMSIEEVLKHLTPTEQALCMQALNDVVSKQGTTTTTHAHHFPPSTSSN